MNWYQASKKYLEDKGYEYLGEDGRLLFYKDKNGNVWGSGEDAIAKYMIEEGYWG